MAAAQEDTLAKKVTESLECPMCLEPILEPPVFRCGNEHIFCKSCYDKLKISPDPQCPVCRQPLAGQRARFIERFVSTLPLVKCKHWECNRKFVVGQSKEVADHEVACKHRTVSCYVCDSKVGIDKMIDHLTSHEYCTDQYTVNLGDYDQHRLSLKSKPNVTSTTYFVEVHSKEEKFVFYRCLHKGRYLFWVGHDQGPDASKRFKYTISVLCGKANAEGKTLKLATYIGFCKPLDTPLATIKEEQECLSLSENYIRKSRLHEDSGPYYLDVGIDR